MPDKLGPFYGLLLSPSQGFFFGHRCLLQERERKREKLHRGAKDEDDNKKQTLLIIGLLLAAHTLPLSLSLSSRAEPT